jgi:hypothetical protein
VIVSVALDEASLAREWIDAAAPETSSLAHQALVDPEHITADRLGITNIPTTVWIDEDDRVVRPPVIAPVDDLYKEFTKIDSAVHHEQLRAWVRDGTLPPVREVEGPTPEHQEALAERRLGAFLYRRGNAERAAVHFGRAAELDPMDFTIRRGTLPMLGDDPFGATFFEFVAEWMEAGSPGYKAADSQ